MIKNRVLKYVLGCNIFLTIERKASLKSIRQILRLNYDLKYDFFRRFLLLLSEQKFFTLASPKGAYYCNFEP